MFDGKYTIDRLIVSHIERWSKKKYVRELYKNKTPTTRDGHGLKCSIIFDAIKVWGIVMLYWWAQIIFPIFNKKNYNS